MYAGSGRPVSVRDSSGAAPAPATRNSSAPTVISSPTCMCEPVPFIEPAKHTAFAAKQRRIGHVELKRLACQGGILGGGGYLSLYLLHHNIPFQTTIHPHESDDDSGSRPTPSSVAGRVLTAPDGQPTKLPMIVLDGVPFFGLVPTARYLARRVGDYGNDSQLDWRTDTVLERFSAWRDALAATAAAKTPSHGGDANRYKKVCRVHNYDRASALLLGPECDEHDQERCIGFVGSSSRQPSLSDIFMFGIIWDDCIMYGTQLMERRYPRVQAFFRWVLHSSPPVLAECRHLMRRGGVCWPSFPELGVPHCPSPPQQTTPTMFAYADHIGHSHTCGCGEVHPDAATNRREMPVPVSVRPPPPPAMGPLCHPPMAPPPHSHGSGAMFLRPGHHPVHPPVVMMPPPFVAPAPHARPPHP